MTKQLPLIILCGLSGTGKTRSSQIIQRQLNHYQLIGPGSVRERLGITTYSRKDTPKILAQIIEQIEENHHANRGSILDANLKSVDLRQFFYDLAKHLGEEVIVIEHCCSPELAQQRMQQREQLSAAENPKDPRVHDDQKKIWQDTLLDISMSENNHVSLIRFDTERNECSIFRKNQAVSVFIENIVGCLTQLK